MELPMLHKLKMLIEKKFFLKILIRSTHIMLKKERVTLWDLIIFQP